MVEVGAGGQGMALLSLTGSKSSGELETGTCFEDKA